MLVLVLVLVLVVLVVLVVLAVLVVLVSLVLVLELVLVISTSISISISIRLLQDLRDAPREAVRVALLAAIGSARNASGYVRPISLLTLSLLTLLDSNLPGNPLWAWESHP